MQCSGGGLAHTDVSNWLDEGQRENAPLMHPELMAEDGDPPGNAAPSIPPTSGSKA